MAVLSRKRYTVASDFSLRDRDGLIHHLVAGDELPAELQALLNDRELQAHLSVGMFKPVGWRPPPRQVEVSRKPPTVAEVLDGLELPASGPRGVEIRQLDKPPTPKDLQGCAAAGGPTVVVVHQLPDGTSVATLDFARLMGLYASSHGAR
jgi:hypothetical protein